MTAKSSMLKSSIARSPANKTSVREPPWPGYDRAGLRPGAKGADRLADIAHSKLEELIVTLELPPGSLWSEVMLSERIGIGRTPVREAVQRLAWERLVTIIRRHGIRISEIDVHEQMLVVEMRRELERLVATRAARRATVDERRYISKTADLFMEAGATDDALKFLFQGCDFLL